MSSWTGFHCVGRCKYGTWKLQAEDNEYGWHIRGEAAYG